MRSWRPLVLVVALAACSEEAKPVVAPAPTPTPAPSVTIPAPVVAPETPKSVPTEIDSRVRAVLDDPTFAGVDFKWEQAGPFLVFQQVNQEDVRDTIREYDDKYGAFKEEPIEGTTNPAKIERNIRWAEKADSLAKREATLLSELDRRFRELFAERLTLPKLEDKARHVTIVVLWTRKNFVKALPKYAGQASESVRVEFRPEQHEVVTYLGDEFLMNEDEVVCADGHRQKTGDQDLLAFAAEQLLREYAAVVRGPLFRDPPPRSPRWFTSGFAEWLAAVELAADKLAAPRGMDVFNERIRLDHVRDARLERAVAEKWRIRELMKPMHLADEHTLGCKLAPEHGSRMASFFEIRAWALCHFFWNYADGKYRDALTDYLGLALAGEASSSKFAELMKRPSALDWGDVEMEFEWYWNQLLMRKVGRNKATQEWATPTTTPPEGTVEKDEEFLAYWKESHAK